MVRSGISTTPDRTLLVPRVTSLGFRDNLLELLLDIAPKKRRDDVTHLAMVENLDILCTPKDK
jgi:hypothetical protein